MFTFIRQSNENVPLLPQLLHSHHGGTWKMEINMAASLTYMLYEQIFRQPHERACENV